jgi:uncharacterized membrane protein YhaH (DUF805 family)
MNFGQAIGSGFGRYVDFQGRSSRSEFWYFLIFYYIALFVGFFSTGVIFSIAGENNPTADGFASLIDCLVVLVFALPSLAVQVRRLHDSNRSGWLCLLSLTVVGAIPVLIWLCTRGTMGENRFGRDPLDAASAGAVLAMSWSS